MSGRGGPDARAPLPDLPLPSDPDLQLPDIYLPPQPGPEVLADDNRRGGRRNRPPIGERDEDRPLPTAVVALTRAAPNLMVAVVVIAGLLATPYLPTSDLPVTLVLVVVSQLVGFVVARSNGLWLWSRAFLMNVAVVIGLLPLLAIQVSTTRAPYVSAELGTARPAILATVAVVAGVVVCAIAAMAWDAAPDAALLFLPTSLLVPALLGTSYAVGEDTVARLLAEVYMLTAVATILAVLVRPLLASLLGVTTLGIYFGVLLIADRGPTQEPTSDDIARILDGSLVLVTVVLTIAVPVGAAGLRRVMREVRAADRLSRIERVGRS